MPALNIKASQLADSIGEILDRVETDLATSGSTELASLAVRLYEKKLAFIARPDECGDEFFDSLSEILDAIERIAW